jgi:hypothetical protein
MAGTAPGFVALLHLWLAVSLSPVWSALPAFVFGIAGLVSTAVIFRRLQMDPWITTIAVVVVATSPVAVATSGHVKQYTLDYLIAIWIMFFATRATSGSTTALTQLAMTSVLGLGLSGSAIVPISGAWIVVIAHALRRRKEWAHVLRATAVVSGSCLVLVLAFYSALPVALNRYWSNALLGPTPLSTWPSRLNGVVRGLLTGLIATTTSIPHDVLLISVLAVCLIALGVLSRAPSPLRSIAVATLTTAVVLSVSSRVPLGTGRTDMAIYPALLVLVLSGVAEIWSAATTRPHLSRRGSQVIGSVLVAVVVVTSVATPHPYLATPITQATATALSCAPNGQPTLVVDAYTRYPYALTTPQSVSIAFSREYGAGFTVAVPRSQAFILPAQPYERPYTPVKWADEIASESTHDVLAYLQTPPEGPNAAEEAQRSARSSGVHDSFLAELVRLGYSIASNTINGPLLVTCLDSPHH